MRVRSLGHVVLKVKDLQRSEAFYNGVMEMPVATRISDPVRMTLFTIGNHHDFGIMEVGADAPSPDPGATGLAHVAFKVGDSREDFDALRSHLDSVGIETLYIAERAFTTSVHLLDPDGHEVELYIDTADDSKTSVLV
jgi:catechol 2,3-dioxygenase